MPARIGLIANVAKAGAAQLTADVQREFARLGGELLLERGTAELLGQQSDCTATDLAAKCDFLVVLGGDGTLLQVVHEIRGNVPPIFGINIGSLGFLTSVSSSDWRPAVESLVSKNFTLSERTLLEVQVVRGDEILRTDTALNDAVVSRGELSRLIKMDVLIDGAKFSEYNADGLIVATPTGSTAYSLSAGGPVLTPDSGVFVISPICPHVLTMRPMIVSDASTLEIVASAQQSNIFLTLDGQNAIHVAPGDRIRVAKSPHRLALAMLPGTTFFDVLKQKLKWSGTAI